MLAVVIAFCFVGQVADPPLSDAARTERLRQLLAPIHLSDPVAPIVKEALEKRVTLSFQETPLSKVVEQLSPSLGGNIWIADLPDNDGKPAEPPKITYRCHETVLADALQAMLAPYELSFRFAYEGIEICDFDLCRKVDEWRIYPIPDLVGKFAGDDIHLLREIQETVERDSWEPNGGDGRIEMFPRSFFIVGASADVHRRMADFFALKRLSLRAGPTRTIGVLHVGDGPPNVGEYAIHLQASERFLRPLERTLARRSDFEIRNDSVDEAAATLQRTLGVPVTADSRGLEKVRLTTVRKGVTGRAVLQSLERFGVYWHVTKDGVVLDDELRDANPNNPRKVIRHTWRYYPSNPVTRLSPVQGVDRRDVSRYLTQVIVMSYANNQICFQEWPDYLPIDWPFVTGFCFYGPRREHRRFEELYAGIREALARRDEISRLTELPAPAK